MIFLLLFLLGCSSSIHPVDEVDMTTYSAPDLSFRPAKELQILKATNSPSSIHFAGQSEVRYGTGEIVCTYADFEFKVKSTSLLSFYASNLDGFCWLVMPLPPEIKDRLTDAIFLQIDMTISLVAPDNTRFTTIGFLSSEGESLLHDKSVVFIRRPGPVKTTIRITDLDGLRSIEPVFSLKSDFLLPFGTNDTTRESTLSFTNPVFTIGIP